MAKKAFLILLFFFASVQLVHGASSLYVTPSSGSFIAGETFTVSIYVNTGDDFINAVEAHLTFSPDKLQVVSPSTGRSFIDVWVGQPQYSNTAGTLSFQGAIPTPGIKTSRGLISTVTFRVKAPGTTVLKFTDRSRVLLNDGQGTDILTQKTSGIYNLTLPPPAGPIVVSTAHPDQSRWYPNSSAVLKWTNEFPSNGYSFILNKEPIDVPDDIPEKNLEGVTYQDLADGTHYFHIKALAGGVWGATSHFALNIDASSPADFDINVSPSKITSQREPIIGFITTDALSGISHYEIKVVDLAPSFENGELAQSHPFFVEATSPYVPSLEVGKYDLIVRAYDKAGNVYEVKDQLRIVNSVVLGFLTSFWPWIILILLILLLATAYVTWRMKLWRAHFERFHTDGVLNSKNIKSKLAELKKYRQKYGHLAVVILLTLTLSFTFSTPASAQNVVEVELDPPIVTSISKNISNEEIFYIGGKVVNSQSEVIVYLQNIETGQTQSFVIQPDEKNDWFYTHDSFLISGQYLLWAQSKVSEVISPPSAREQISVSRTAIQIGASRISYNTTYQFVILVLLILIAGFIVQATRHYRKGKKFKEAITRELGEAEEAIRKGFALLKRDIERELETVHKAKFSPELKEQEREREEQLKADLEFVQANIGKEVHDIWMKT